MSPPKKISQTEKVKKVVDTTQLDGVLEEKLAKLINIPSKDLCQEDYCHNYHSNQEEILNPASDEHNLIPCKLTISNDDTGAIKIPTTKKEDGTCAANEVSKVHMIAHEDGKTCSLLNIFKVVDLNMAMLLDPTSLKNLRCLSKEWNQFISEYVWGTIKGKEMLERKLNYLWRNADVEKSISVICWRTGGYHNIAFDMEVVCVGKGDGYLEVVDSATGIPRFKVDCILDDERAGPFSVSDKEMLISVGEDIIAVGVEEVLSIFNKDTGDLVYQRMPHGEDNWIQYMEIFGKSVVTAASDDTIRLCEKSETGRWKSKLKIPKDEELHVRSLHVDGDWLAVHFFTFGLEEHIQIWSLKQMRKKAKSGPSKVLTIPTVTSGMWNLKLHQDSLTKVLSIFVVDFVQPENLHVLNANSGEEIRTVKIQCSSIFSSLSLLSNRDFLFVCEKMETGKDIFMYSINELIDSSIPDEQLWTRVLAIGDWYEVAVNKTGLVTSDYCGGVRIHKFWDDEEEYSDEDSDEDIDEESDY